MTDAGAASAHARSDPEKCEAHGTLSTRSDTATDLPWAETGLAALLGSISLSRAALAA